MGGWVCIVTNRPNGTLYVGVTSDLARRAWEHGEGVADGFTGKYGLKRLVWAEFREDIRAAMTHSTGVIALSHVQFSNGFRSDLEALGKIKGDHLLVVNASQSAGAIAIDVKPSNASKNLFCMLFSFRGL